MNLEEIISFDFTSKVMRLFAIAKKIFMFIRRNVFCQIAFVILCTGFEIVQFIDLGLDFENFSLNLFLKKYLSKFIIKDSFTMTFNEHVTGPVLNFTLKTAPSEPNKSKSQVQVSDETIEIIEIAKIAMRKILAVLFGLFTLSTTGFVHFW